MPFTLAHVAAAMPLRRSRLILSALIVGTMAPDFEYFVRLRPGGGWGHTIPGAFGLSLPLGLAVLWLFHSFAKAPAVALLPQGVQRRLGRSLLPFRFLGMRRFLMILLSLLVGIATHLAWDSFTHSRGWFYHHFGLLHRHVVLPWLHRMSVYTFLQIFSSVAGVLILWLWLRSWYRATPPGPLPLLNGLPRSQKTLVRAAILALTVGGGVLRGYLNTGIPHNRYKIDDFIGSAVVAIGALLWWQLVAWGALMRVGATRSAPQSEPTTR
ncbi:MAG: DUF4184 family protein [Terracidiphilus sp.]